MITSKIRHLFPGLKNKIYMNTASMAIGNSPAQQAYQQALTRWIDGEFDFTEAENAGEDARRLFSTFIGADVDEIALVPAVSTAAGIVASQFGQAKPGENILVADFEFSSNYFPWVLLKERGYEIRVVPSREGMVLNDSYAALADGKTRLIAASAVQSTSGFRANLSELSQIAHQSNAWFFVDGCQAVGAVPLDVKRDGIDILATASHKFLLGTRGMGYLYLRRELLDQFKPILPGWKAAQDPLQSFYGPTIKLSTTASKLDTSLAWFPALAERASLQIIRQVGLDTILERNQHLTQYLYTALLESDMQIKTFSIPHRSTIHSIPVKITDQLMDKLRSENIVVSLRAGSIRLALHFYNLEQEIDTVVDMITQ